MVVDIANVGDFYPLSFPPEPGFRKQFQETGFWSEKEGRLLIVDEADMILGDVAYFRSVNYFDGYEIGFIIFNPKNRNKGIATEAVKLFVDYLFKVKNINRLQMVVPDSHAASIKIAEICGFRYEGTARKAVFHAGEYIDMKVFSILRNEAAAENG